MRFYKAAANTGTHVAAVERQRDPAAQATFTSETASGWQQGSFSTPVAVTAGTTYVVSYSTPTGTTRPPGQRPHRPGDGPPLYAVATAKAPDGNGVYS